MKSNNGYTAYKRVSISFINKTPMLLLDGFFLLIFGVCSYFLAPYWNDDIPVSVKIIWIFLISVFSIGFILIAINGLYIGKKGNIVFIPDLRIKRIKLFNLERISINFNEWENGKYSATVKYLLKNGKIFLKDYSMQFKNHPRQKFLRAMYTLNKTKVDKICKKLAPFNICNITIINDKGDIISQELATKS